MGQSPPFRLQAENPGNDSSLDSQDLANFGYKQELYRTLGSFSSFAAGFSYISILTGMFQMFYVGFGSAGPAFFWTWPLVFVGQFLVALCFAELAAHYPLSGSVYQWAKQIGHRAVGWMAGWVYLACLVITLAAVALALRTPVPDILYWAGFGNGPDAFKNTQTAVFLGCLLILFTTLINSIGVRLLARINNLGVFAELIGALVLTVLLAVHACRGPEVVLVTQGKGEGDPFGYLGPFLAAALMASYVMYGFDTAGSLAEETTDPRRKAPRAILQALAAAALVGGFLMLFALMAASNLNTEALGDENQGLLYIVEETLGKDLSMVFVCDIIFAITVCTLAVHTGTGRLMFAMARDNKLPFGSALAHVSPTSRTPVLPIVVSGLVASVVLIVLARYKKLTEIVTGAAILSANLAYLFVTVPLLLHRLRGWPEKGNPPARGFFSLGRWGLPINLLAVLWGLGVVVNIGWPRADIYGSEWYERYSVIFFTAGLLAVGAAYYGLVQRHKGGVIAEHKANGS
jgi:urea carboxylase system permease